MTITPTIVTGTPPLVVTTDNPSMTYATLLNMLGPYIFEVDTLYYRPQNINQFSQIPGYNNYDQYGNANGEMLITVPDTWQFNPAMLLYLKDKKIIFEGTGRLDFNMLPQEQVQLFLMGQQRKITNALNVVSPGNFKRLEGQMGRPAFFTDYTEEI